MISNHLKIWPFQSNFGSKLNFSFFLSLSTFFSWSWKKCKILFFISLSLCFFQSIYLCFLSLSLYISFEFLWESFLGQDFYYMALRVHESGEREEGEGSIIRLVFPSPLHGFFEKKVKVDQGIPDLKISSFTKFKTFSID